MKSQRVGCIYEIAEVWLKAIILSGAERLEMLMTGQGKEGGMTLTEQVEISCLYEGMPFLTNVSCGSNSVEKEWSR